MIHSRRYVEAIKFGLEKGITMCHLHYAIHGSKSDLRDQHA